MAGLNESEAFRLLVDLDLILCRLQNVNQAAIQATGVISLQEVSQQPSSEAIDALCKTKGEMVAMSMRELIRDRTGR